MALAGQIQPPPLAAQVGRPMRVLIDRVEAGTAIARGPGCPKIDGLVRFAANGSTRVGNLPRFKLRRPTLTICGPVCCKAYQSLTGWGARLGAELWRLRAFTMLE